MGSGVGFTLHITSSEWFSYLLFMWSVLEVVQGLALRLCVTSQACAEHKEYFSYTCSFSSFWRSGIVGTWYLLQPFKWTPVVADDCNPWFRSFEVKVEVPADSVGFQTKPLAVWRSAPACWVASWSHTLTALNLIYKYFSCCFPSKFQQFCLSCKIKPTQVLMIVIWRVAYGEIKNALQVQQ